MLCVNAQHASSTLPPPAGAARCAPPAMGACPEHLTAWTWAHDQATLTTAPAKPFLLPWHLQGLVLTTAGVFRSRGEFGCLCIFFPQPSKNHL